MARQEGHVGDRLCQQELKMETNLFNLECTFNLECPLTLSQKNLFFFSAFFQTLLVNLCVIIGF